MKNDAFSDFAKKCKHKGFMGFLKFVKDFKYKNPAASFVVYKNIRKIQ